MYFPGGGGGREQRGGGRLDPADAWRTWWEGGGGGQEGGGGGGGGFGFFAGLGAHGVPFAGMSPPFGGYRTGIMEFPLPLLHLPRLISFPTRHRPSPSRMCT